MYPCHGQQIIVRINWGRSVKIKVEKKTTTIKMKCKFESKVIHVSFRSFNPDQTRECEYDPYRVLDIRILLPMLVLSHKLSKRWFEIMSWLSLLSLHFSISKYDSFFFVGRGVKMTLSSFIIMNITLYRETFPPSCYQNKHVRLLILCRIFA